MLLEPARTLTLAEIAVLSDPTVSTALKAVFDGTSSSTPYDWENWRRGYLRTGQIQ